MRHRDSAPTFSPSTISKREKVIATMDKIGLKTDQLDGSEDHDSKREGTGIDGNTSPATTTTTAKGPKRKFRIIDETQLSEEEARKLELRRAYNRDCASRARTRTKSLVQELQEQVRTLKQEKEELRQSNANLQACLAFSEKQNQELIAKHSLLDGRSMNSAALGTRDLSLLHPSSLQGMRLGSNNLATTSRLMYEAEQSRQLNYLQHDLLLQQQQNAASAVSAINSSKLYPTQSSTAMNNMNLSSNEQNLRDQILSLNSAPNSDVLAALLRMRQNDT
jgi:hypothetical protein